MKARERTTRAHTFCRFVPIIEKTGERLRERRFCVLLRVLLRANIVVGKKKKKIVRFDDDRVVREL